MKRIIIPILIFVAAVAWPCVIIGGFILSNMGESIAFTNLLANADNPNGGFGDQHPWQLVVGQDLMLLAVVIPLIAIALFCAWGLIQIIIHQIEGTK